MDERISLEIVTPDRQLVKEIVDEVTAPGSEGYFGVLPGHIPFLTTLKIGEIAYRKDRETRYLAVSWGYAQVEPDKVAILAEIAEPAEEIDVERAQRARLRAEKRLEEKDGELDFERARISLEKALIRLQVASKRLSQ
ncbi:MAG: F0F1 ATP synthase subunit epsilon [Candidatus Tectomicrobia bacterium]|uniref:ATP synthase epsilon chain n=1 Tax=Tectimicrobiota bacterium TaxID=2528274 RepID=A0A932CN73_UNCTE|nr:F0F1 ATP synthase subunit epsilon [Candidatus Tectomicrobia bacterium]